jgi:hypothetical protein
MATLYSTERIKWILSAEGNYFFGPKEDSRKEFTPYAWGKWPDKKEYPKIKSIQLFPNDKQLKGKLPAFIGELPGLRTISMPVEYLSELEQGDLPASLSAILLHNAKNAKADFTWPEGVVLKELKFFGNIGSRNPLLGITPTNFPKLNWIELDLDDKKKANGVIDELTGFSALEAIVLGHLGSNDIFSKLKGQPVRLLSLDVVRGDDFPIEKLPLFGGLEIFRLNNLKRDLDCNIFTQVKDLLEVEILNSYHVKNVEALLKCKKLQSIKFVNCKDPFKQSKALFTEKGYKNLEIKFA